MQDEIEVKLPVSGKTVVVRNYTTFADDEAALEVLYDGARVDGGGESMPLANGIKLGHWWVKRLVKSIEGSTADLSTKLGELRSLDYTEVKKTVDEVVAKNSPKVNMDGGA